MNILINIIFIYLLGIVLFYLFRITLDYMKKDSDEVYRIIKISTLWPFLIFVFIIVVFDIIIIKTNAIINYFKKWNKKKEKKRKYNL